MSEPLPPAQSAAPPLTLAPPSGEPPRSPPVTFSPLHFEDLQVGQSWRSRGRTVTQTDVVNFACVTGDFDPLHVDHVAAEKLPFHQPIAHGLLGLTWVAGLGSTNPAVASLAFVSISNWEFLRPIYFGDTLVAVNEIVRLTPKGKRRGNVVWQRKLLNQKGEIVQQGTFETMVACRESSSASALPEPPVRTASPVPLAPPAPTPPAIETSAAIPPKTIAPVPSQPPPAPTLESQPSQAPRAKPQATKSSGRGAKTTTARRTSAPTAAKPTKRQAKRQAKSPVAAKSHGEPQAPASPGKTPRRKPTSN